jgi:hypothetical protein
LQEEFKVKKALQNRQIQRALKVKYHEGVERKPGAAITTACCLILSIDLANAMAKIDRQRASARKKCKVRL